MCQWQHCRKCCWISMTKIRVEHFQGCVKPLLGRIQAVLGSCFPLLSGTKLRSTVRSETFHVDFIPLFECNYITTSSLYLWLRLLKPWQLIFMYRVYIVSIILILFQVLEMLRKKKWKFEHLKSMYKSVLMIKRIKVINGRGKKKKKKNEVLIHKIVFSFGIFL